MHPLELVKPWLRPKLFNLCEQFAFGHREVLLFTKELDPYFAFESHIQHGWVRDGQSERPKTFDRNLKPTYDLVWSHRIARERRHINKNTIAIGSPFVHLLKYLGFAPHQRSSCEYLNSNNGTYDFIYFPSHGFQDILVDQRRFVLSSNLGNSKGAVSLFWADFVNPKNRLFFKQQNLDILCAGYRGSSAFEVPWSGIGGRVLFLLELMNIFSKTKVLIFDEVATAFWYGVLIGKQILIQRDEYSYSKVKGSNSSNLLVSGIERVPYGEIFEPSDELHAAATEEVGWYETANFSEVLDRNLLFRPRELVNSPDYSLQLRSHIEGLSPKSV